MLVCVFVIAFSALPELLDFFAILENNQIMDEDDLEIPEGQYVGGRDHMGRFAAGPKWWGCDEYRGRPPRYDSEEALWADCLKFFKHCEENPLLEDKIASENGVPVHVTVTKAHTPTIQGLCVYIGICADTWCSWRNEGRFPHIVPFVDQIIFTRKYTLAAAGLIVPNFIAQDLGFVSKQDHTSSDGSMSPTKIECVIVDPANPDS